MLVPIILLYIILNFIQSPVKPGKKVIIPGLALILVLVASRLYTKPMLADRGIDLYKHTLFVLQHPFLTTTNFLTSIGNLMLGWFIPFDELYISLTSANFWTQITGYILVFSTILIGIKFWQKKTEPLKICLFFLLWVFLFYFPSWFTQTHYVKGGVISSVSNRYLAISSVGFIGLISYLINFIKPKYQAILLLLVISFNIWSSERGLIASSIYRSQAQQDYLYNLIDQDLPKGDEKNDLLLFLGNDWLKNMELDWNGFYPLAVKRNIQNTGDFPTIVSTLDQAKSILCSNPPKFKLARFYAWKLQNNRLYNVTEKARQVIKCGSADEKS